MITRVLVLWFSLSSGFLLYDGLRGTRPSVCHCPAGSLEVFTFQQAPDMPHQSEANFLAQFILAGRPQVSLLPPGSPFEDSL